MDQIGSLLGCGGYVSCRMTNCFSRFRHSALDINADSFLGLSTTRSNPISLPHYYLQITLDPRITSLSCKIVAMRLTQASLLAACVPAITARFVETAEANNVVLTPEETFLVETAPGKTQWVTEEDKWEMRRVRRLR